MNEASGGRFRLIGIGAKSLVDADEAPPEGDLFAPGAAGPEARRPDGPAGLGACRDDDDDDDADEKADIVISSWNGMS